MGAWAGRGEGGGGVYLLCSAVTFAHLTPVLGNFQLSLVWVRVCCAVCRLFVDLHNADNFAHVRGGEAS